MVDERKEWPEWPDALGVKYKPGDNVAYASVSGSAAYLQFAEVFKINKVDSKGKPLLISQLDDGDRYAKAALDNHPPCPVSYTGRYWEDPVYVTWAEGRDKLHKAWQATRQRVHTPTATVTLIHKGGSKTNLKNLHNILKVS